MLKQGTSRQFERDYVKQAKRKKDMVKLQNIMELLLDEVALPLNLKDHPLQ